MLQIACIALQEVENIEIICLVDNYMDINLPNQNLAKRYRVFRDGQVASGLLAEHGLSLLIKVSKNNEQHGLLLDGGWSDYAAPYNLAKLGIAPAEIEAVLLSHGHFDHFAGLPAALRYLGRQIPLYCHPEVFREHRYLLAGKGERYKFPILTRESLTNNGAQIHEASQAQLLARGLLAASGEIARTTDFEQGMPGAIIASPEGDHPDLFPDDQALIANVADKGLVVISGCAHAGIINTLRWAQKLTGVERIFAVLGGFHLSGPAYRHIVEPTLAELERLAPEVLVPMHCTGWETVQQIARRFPRQFIPNSVGTRFIF